MKKEKGFTLIELLVVIAIIGVLAALVVANFNAARERARDAQRKSDLNQISKALRLYYNDNNLYPNSVPFRNVFESATGVVYMKFVPDDPQYDSASYSYQVSGTPVGQDFCVWGGLENEADPDALESQTRCSAGCSGLGLEETDYIVCAD